MHVIVIGAGIIGMMTAYYLVREGHAVSVVDAGTGPGAATSRANGAQLSYSFVAPLADPAVLPKLPSWLIGRDTPLRFRPRLDPDQWRWGLSFLNACRHDKSRRTTAELLQLGLYSRLLMHELVDRENPQFDFKSSGKLLVYQDSASYTAGLKQLEYQAGLGCRQTPLTRQACLDLEPALDAVGEKVYGGIFTATEDSGDCMRLCAELERKLRAAAEPVAFHFNTAVTRMRTSGRRVAALLTSAGEMQADAYVMANGMGAQRLARQVGINPGIYPLKGYSLTYDLTPDSVGPNLSVSDIARKVVYARLGSRLRVAGMVDIGDRTDAVDPRRIASLKQDVHSFFPKLNAAGEPRAWAGLRPARADGKPLIGATRYGNLWLNVGHGALGFTLAAGSAGLLADQIVGRRGEIPQDTFSLKA